MKKNLDKFYRFYQNQKILTPKTELSIKIKKSLPRKPKFPSKPRLCSQGVLDPLIVPCPMSLGCAGSIDAIVLFKENAFLRTSAHESVPLVGYSRATCWLLAPLPLWGATSPNASGLERNGFGPCWGEPETSEWRDLGEICVRMNRY